MPSAKSWFSFRIANPHSRVSVPQPPSNGARGGDDAKARDGREAGGGFGRGGAAAARGRVGFARGRANRHGGWGAGTAARGFVCNRMRRRRPASGPAVPVKGRCWGSAEEHQPKGKATEQPCSKKVPHSFATLGGGERTPFTQQTHSKLPQWCQPRSAQRARSRIWVFCVDCVVYSRRDDPRKFVGYGAQEPNSELRMSRCAL